MEVSFFSEQTQIGYDLPPTAAFKKATALRFSAIEFRLKCVLSCLLK